MSRENDAPRIHVLGAALFLFIPLVLFLFLRFPFGILPSFALAISIMVAHRFVASRFFLTNLFRRCFWCGKTHNPRSILRVKSGDELNLEFCRKNCADRAQHFFRFCECNRLWIRAGIFLPLVWYVVTMLLYAFGIKIIPAEWNRFVFQFTIALTVVAVSFASLFKVAGPGNLFPFPIHNLFLLGAKNTLLIFRYVGLWWISAGIYFLYRTFDG